MRQVTLLLALVTVLGVSCTRPGQDGGSAGGDEAATRRFEAVSDQTVRDSTTNLVWTAHDGERNFAWPEAEIHCAALRLDERSDWRLPEIDELSAVYDDTTSTPCGDQICRLDPAIALTNPYVWSGTERGGGRRFYIDFKFGTRLAPLIRPRLVRRVLCVHNGAP